MSESAKKLIRARDENRELRKRIVFLLGVILGVASGDPEATAIAMEIVRDAKANAEPKPAPASKILIQ